jgi:glycosyltransferase involved in cell wall biosynthesis
MTVATLLHISCDYPDPLNPSKTRAFFNLIEGTQGYRHIVYSLNRVSWRKDIAALEFAPDRIALAYGAPPRGILLATRLARVAEWIRRDLERRRIAVDLVHAHKFAIESLVAAPLARHFAAKLVCSVHGDTDLRVMGVRRDLRPRWRSIAGDCAALLPAAPWAERGIAASLGGRMPTPRLLPCIARTERFTASRPVGPRLVTVLNLNAHRRKNLPALIGVVAGARRRHRDISLDIYGAGGAPALLEVAEAIHRADAADCVTLKGPVANERLHELLNGYGGFVMPTLRDSFGMVFVEALFAGLPILHSRGTSIDGYVENEATGYAADPHDLADIGRGIERLIAEEASLKASIARLHERGGLDVFKRETILRAYRMTLDEALGGARAPTPGTRLAVGGLSFAT